MKTVETSIEVSTEKKRTKKARYVAGVYSDKLNSIDFVLVGADYFWSEDEAIEWMVVRHLKQRRRVYGTHYIELWKRMGDAWVLLAPEEYESAWRKEWEKNETCIKAGITRLPVPKSSNKRPGHGLRTPEEMHQAFGFRLDRL